MWPLRNRQQGGRTSKHKGVAEVEPFLCGRYARHLINRKRPVPPWAWLNALAHGSSDDIIALTLSEPRRHTPWNSNEWERALAFLALEVINQVTKRDGALTQLQRSTLVPLELELAGERSHLTPAQFVLMVLCALDRPASRHT